MSTSLLMLAGVLVLGLAAIGLIFVLGMRTKSSLVLTPLIRLQRVLLNPRQMRSAGTAGAYAGIIRHRGRTSGRAYETPIGVEEVDGGFVIALPYGSRTNWLRNVLAAGTATIVHEGNTWVVDQPEVVAMGDVLVHFSAGDQRSARLLGTDLALRIRRVEQETRTHPAAETTGGDAARAGTVVPGMPS